MILEKKYIIGGLNVDDAYNVLPKEDYQNAENIRIVVGDDGKAGIVKNVPGNLEVSNPNYIEGYVIGGIEDKENQRCFYFVYNGDAQSRIFCYRYKTNDIKVVLKEEDFSLLPPNIGLNFPADRKITGIAIVGDILYWTDALNEPRKINVERAMAGYDAGSMSWNDEDITIIRPQPILPLEVEKLVSADEPLIPTRTNNFIAESSFQFAHRYVYEDYEYSALSVYSELANYNNDDGGEDYDTIEIRVPTFQVIPDRVLKVQILYRNGNTGSFSIIKEFDPSTHKPLTPLRFYFYNEKNGNQISDEVAYKLFDNVPKTSKALEGARNRVFLGNNKFGYDPLTDLGISVAIDEITVGGFPEEGTFFYGQYLGINPNKPTGKPDTIAQESIYLVITSGANEGIYITDLVKNYPNWDDDNLPTSYLDDWNNGNLPASITVSPSARIGSSSMSDSTLANLDFDVPNGWVRTGVINRVYAGVDPLIYGLTGTPIESGYRQWKRGSKYRFGIVFYDNYGRNNGVYTNDDMIFTTPERIYTQTEYNGNAVWTITSGGEDIPTWATHYQIVRTKNLLVSSFLQHFTRNPQYVSKDDDGVYVFGTDFSTEDTIGLAFDISRIDNDGLGYTYAEGDVLKYFASDDTEREILNVIDQQGKYVIVEPIDLGDLAEAGNEKRVGVIEIYTPAKEEDIFYEIGKVYRVTNPNRYNRDFSTKTGTVSGDTYIKVRTISGEGNLPMEAMNINDRHWKEWLTDIGRPNIILYDSGEELRPTNICYSETFVQGTKVNGLSSFNALDQRDLDEQNGPINKLILTSRTQEYGSVMLTICSNETSSIYLGERQVLDNAGTQILATSGEVIGTINNLKGGYGTIHPESVAENEGQVFFFDAIEGKVVRYASNGLVPISDIKMSKFFSEVGKVYSTGYFPGAIDPFASEYLLGIPMLQMSGREYLEDIVTEIYDVSDRSQFTNKDLNVPVAFGDKFIITANAGSDKLTGTTTIYLADEDGSNKIQVYTTSGNGTPMEYTATKSGKFVATTSFFSRIEISKIQNSYHNAFDGQAKVAVFNYDHNRWTDFRLFDPEWMSSVPGLLLSFEEGKLYRHDNTVKNTFYGALKPSLLALVFNEYEVPVKSLRIVQTQGNAQAYTHIRTEQPNLQSSDLLSTEYRVREGVASAGVMKDRLSPNVAGTAEQKLISGDTIRGQYPQVAFQFNLSDELEVYSFTLGYTPSSGHLQ